MSSARRGIADGRVLLLARRRDEATKEIIFSLLVWDEGKITALSEDIEGCSTTGAAGRCFRLSVAADGDGRIYFADGYLIRVFDRSLSLLSDIECGFSVDRMTTLSDGRVAASGYDDYGVGNVYYINPESSDRDVFAVPSGYTQEFQEPGACGSETTRRFSPAIRLRIHSRLDKLGRVSLLRYQKRLLLIKSVSRWLSQTAALHRAGKCS